MIFGQQETIVNALKNALANDSSYSTYFITWNKPQGIDPDFLPAIQFLSLANTPSNSFEQTSSGIQERNLTLFGRLYISEGSSLTSLADKLYTDISNLIEANLIPGIEMGNPTFEQVYAGEGTPESAEFSIPLSYFSQP